MVLPHTETLAQETMFLPIYPGMTARQVDTVADAVIAVYAAL